MGFLSDLLGKKQGIVKSNTPITENRSGEHAYFSRILRAKLKNKEIPEKDIQYVIAICDGLDLCKASNNLYYAKDFLFEKEQRFPVEVAIILLFRSLTEDNSWGILQSEFNTGDLWNFRDFFGPFTKPLNPYEDFPRSFTTPLHQDYANILGCSKKAVAGYMFTLTQYCEDILKKEKETE